MAQAGGSRTIANDVSAITPEIWSQAVQIPLYETLVAAEVCNLDLKQDLKYGDTINIPYFGSMTAQTYVPGTAFTADAQEWDIDPLIVSAYKTVAIYVDDIEQLQANINIRTALQEEIAYQLREAIDTHALLRIKDGTTTGAGSLGGTTRHALTATTANVISLFAGARRVLRAQNVSEGGDWISIISPKVANFLEFKSTSVGYNTADAMLRNGYAGEFMGFKVYISNNLPALTTVSAVYTPALSAQIDGTFECAYFGKAKAIDLVIQAEPTIQITKVPDMHGYNVAAYVVYGDKVCTQNAYRFLNVVIN